LGNVATGIAKVGATAIAGLGVAAGTVGKEMVNLASSAKEAGSAFDVVFGTGESGQQLNEFVEEFANKAGMANFELQDLLKTTGQVVQSVGFTAEESALLGEQLAIVAGDVAAFNNVQGGATPVMQAFTKALLGERESLKTYGITIMEADVQTKAFAMTGKENAKQLTQQEKAHATLELIKERSIVTQGYLNAEQESFAAKSNEARAKLTELKATMGQELLPIAEALLPVLVDLVQEIGPHLVGAIRAVAPFVSAIGQLISDLAPPILAIVSLLLTMLAPAFRKFTEIVEKYITPFLTNLPKNFEKMINAIINGFNRFADKLNAFGEKAQNILGKIGIKLDIPKLRKFENISLGFAESEVKRLTPDEIDAQNELDALVAGSNRASAGLQNVTNNFNIGVNGGGNPDEVARKTVEEVKKFTDRNGTLGRVGVGGGGSGVVIL
jgi:phage-related protein